MGVKKWFLPKIDISIEFYTQKLTVLHFFSKIDHISIFQLFPVISRWPGCMLGHFRRSIMYFYHNKGQLHVTKMQPIIFTRERSPASGYSRHTPWPKCNFSSKFGRDGKKQDKMGEKTGKPFYFEIIFILDVFPH